MTEIETDAPFETLVEALRSQQSDISLTLLREIYDVEKRLQFERDRSKVLVALRKAVDAEISREEAKRDASDETP